MKRSWTKIPLFIVPFFLLVSGCVAHTPVSNSVVFHDATSQSLSRARTFGVGLTGTYSPLRGVVRQVARKQRPEEGQKELPLNPNRLSGGLYFAGFDPEGRYGVSATVGALVAGVDATLQVWRQNYLTASISAPGQGKVFLQHQVYDSPQLGAIVGLGYRHDAFGFEAAAPFSVELKGEGVHSIGVRGTAFVRARGDVNGDFRVGLFTGYAPTLRRAQVSITLAVGRL